MKLLFVNLGDYETTARNSYCREVLAAFKPHFAHIHVLCRGDNTVVEDEGVTYHCGSVRFWMRTALRLRKEVDAVHAQDLYFGGFFAALISTVLAAPLTIRCGGVWRYKITSPVVLLKQSLTWIFAKFASVRATKIIYNSKELREHYPRTHHKSTVVYNGVDTEHFQPRNTKRSGNTRLVYVGRVVVEKGLNELLEALQQVTGYQLTIIGDGPLREELEQQYPGVSFLGRVAHTEIPAIVAEHDALILPSYSEGFPNVVLEAMASGLPVLVSDLPGTREMLSKEQGVFFEPRSAKAIVKALREFKKRNHKEMGASARKRVEQRYDMKRQRERMYAQLFKGRVVIFWDYELQQGIDKSMGGIERTGEEEYEQTNKILDICTKHRIQCVFATVGTVAQEGSLPYHSPSQVRRIKEEGHEVASHSMKHENLAEADEQTIRNTMRESKRALESCTGEAVHTFVPPHNMPFSAYGFSVYKRPGQGWRRSRVGLSQILQIAAEEGYHFYRVHRLSIARLFGRPRVTTGAVVNDVNILDLSTNAGFGRSARAAALQAARKRSTAVVYGHPHSTLDEGDQNLEEFRSFTVWLSTQVERGEIEVMLPGESRCS